MAAYETTDFRRALADSSDILYIKHMPERLKIYYSHWEAGAFDTDVPCLTDDLLLFAF